MDSRSASSRRVQAGEGERSGVARRGLLRGLAGLPLVSLAGCALFQNEIRRTAGPVELDGTTSDETGFEHQGTEKLTLTRTVQVAGGSRDLSLTNYLAAYTRTVPAADAPVASLQAFSTPSVTVGDREANPLWELDAEQLLGRVAAGTQFGAVQDVETVGTEEYPILGGPRTVTVLEGTTVRQGQQVQVRLPTSKFKHDEDILVLLGGYPATLGGEEQIRAALDGLVHPAELRRDGT